MITVHFNDMIEHNNNPKKLKIRIQGRQDDCTHDREIFDEHLRFFNELSKNETLEELYIS